MCDKNMAQTATTDGSRESVWSVGHRTTRLYFILFILQVVAGVALVAWKVGEVDPVAIWTMSAPVVITSAGMSIALVEIGDNIMVLSRGLWERLERQREARREEGREEGRERGREEAFDLMREAAPPDKLEEIDRIIDETRRIIRRNGR